MKKLNRKKRERLMKSLMYENGYVDRFFDRHTDEYWEEAEFALQFGLTANHCRTDEFLDRHTRIAVLAMSLDMTKDEMRKLWGALQYEKWKDRDLYGKFRKPKREGRDNKGVYVGGGGSHGNKIRYPSKKRSLKTWTIFYEMFPWAAERDGWNGKTSSRYQGPQRSNKKKK